MPYLPMGYIINNRVLIKSNSVKREELVWRLGGIPSVNAEVYNKNFDNFDFIGVKFKDTEEKWIISKRLFNDNRQEYLNGKELKYYCDKYFWEVRDK